MFSTVAQLVAEVPDDTREPEGVLVEMAALKGMVADV